MHSGPLGLRRRAGRAGEAARGRLGPVPALMVLVATLMVARVAEARMPRYVGPHPVAASVGGGWCELASVHMHSYMPDRGALYVQTFDGLLFAADPTPFGYRGPRHVYYGHHPVPGHAKAYCYLAGPHYHGFEPKGADYRVVDGAAFWMGEMGEVYLRERAVREKAWEGMYREFAGMRPVVNVKVPEGWKGGGMGADASGSAKSPSASASASAKATTTTTATATTTTTTTTTTTSAKTANSTAKKAGGM